MENKCIFCNEIKPEQILFETDNFNVVFDIDPIQDGHLLIISKKHLTNLTELSKEYLLELVTLEHTLTRKLEKNFPLLGVSIIQNKGKTMDEGTHFHVHMVPRYAEDDFWSNQKVVQHKLAKTTIVKTLNED